MPKNRLFYCQNHPSKNHSFYRFTHFVFQNAIKNQLEIISILFSSPNLHTQTRQVQLHQLQP